VNEPPRMVILQLAKVAIINAAFFFSFVWFIEIPLLRDSIVPPPGMSIDNWIDDFGFASANCTWITVGCSLIWYISALFFLKVETHQDGNKRIFWLVCGLGAVVSCSLVGFDVVERPDEGTMSHYALFPLNSLVPFYISTVFSTPRTFKYIPWGARRLRRYGL
jgi:hypothetical protein